jgi:hypothetical protein
MINIMEENIIYKILFLNIINKTKKFIYLFILNKIYNYIIFIVYK